MNESYLGTVDEVTTNEVVGIKRNIPVLSACLDMQLTDQYTEYWLFLSKVWNAFVDCWPIQLRVLMVLPYPCPQEENFFSYDVMYTVHTCLFFKFLEYLHFRHIKCGILWIFMVTWRLWTQQLIGYVISRIMKRNRKFQNFPYVCFTVMHFIQGYF